MDGLGGNVGNGIDAENRLSQSTVAFLEAEVGIFQPLQGYMDCELRLIGTGLADEATCFILATHCRSWEYLAWGRQIKINCYCVLLWICMMHDGI